MVEKSPENNIIVTKNKKLIVVDIKGLLKVFHISIFACFWKMDLKSSWASSRGGSKFVTWPLGKIISCRTSEASPFLKNVFFFQELTWRTVDHPSYCVHWEDYLSFIRQVLEFLLQWGKCKNETLVDPCSRYLTKCIFV